MSFSTSKIGIGAECSSFTCTTRVQNTGVLYLRVLLLWSYKQSSLRQSDSSSSAPPLRRKKLLSLVYRYCMVWSFCAPWIKRIALLVVILSISLREFNLTKLECRLLWVRMRATIPICSVVARSNSRLPLVLLNVSLSLERLDALLARVLLCQRQLM